jgi:hypothetical protein
MNYGFDYGCLLLRQHTIFYVSVKMIVPEGGLIKRYSYSSIVQVQYKYQYSIAAGHTVGHNSTCTRVRSICLKNIDVFGGTCKLVVSCS